MMDRNSIPMILLFRSQRYSEKPIPTEYLRYQYGPFEILVFPVDFGSHIHADGTPPDLTGVDIEILPEETLIRLFLLLVPTVKFLNVFHTLFHEYFLFTKLTLRYTPSIRSGRKTVKHHPKKPLPSRRGSKKRKKYPIPASESREPPSHPLGFLPWRAPPP